MPWWLSPGSAEVGGAAAAAVVPPYQPIGQCIKGATAADDANQYLEFEPGGTVVGLAASGGGSRAAYLAAAILREMRASSVRIETEATPQARLLLDHQLSPRGASA